MSRAQKVRFYVCALYQYRPVEGDVSLSIDFSPSRISNVFVPECVSSVCRHCQLLMSFVNKLCHPPGVFAERLELSEAGVC